MGLFNEVTVECPECGEIHIHQSKAGSCSLSCKAIDNADIADVQDFVDDCEIGIAFCEHCSHQFQTVFNYIYTVKVL